MAKLIYGRPSSSKYNPTFPVLNCASWLKRSLVDSYCPIRNEIVVSRHLQANLTVISSTVVVLWQNVPNESLSRTVRQQPPLRLYRRRRTQLYAGEYAPLEVSEPLATVSGARHRRKKGLSHSVPYWPPRTGPVRPGSIVRAVIRYATGRPSARYQGN